MGKFSVVRNKLFVVSFLAVCSVPLAWANGTPGNISPAELVREAVHNEVAANTNPTSRFMFKDQRSTVHRSEIKLIVETRDATAGLLIEQDGHALSPDERKQEMARLDSYMNNSDALQKKRKQEKEDADRTEKILKALPDAFLYEDDGIREGSPTVGHEGDQLVRLKFRPNPKYDPPSRVEQILTGMYGHLLIDTTEKRVAEIDGTLRQEVGFGWGILGHLDPGGRFFVQQADVGDHHWEVTRMELSFTGKILFFKKLNIKSKDVFSDFHAVPPDLTFAQGVELLKKETRQSESANGGSARYAETVSFLTVSRSIKSSLIRNPRPGALLTAMVP